MASRYQKTQLGWVILISTVPIGLLLLVLAVASGQSVIIGIVALLVLSAAALFGSLTVSIDGDAVEARFGVGLIRKRVALADVRAVAPVTNPWYYGWGLRLFPGGVLYNVSGSYAVEIHLRDGSKCRIGTDEPEALAAAITAAAGPLEPLTTDEIVRDTARSRRWGVALAAVMGTIVLGVGGLVAAQGRPTVVTVDDQTLAIDVLFYGERIALSDVRSVSLEERLPPILMRTNGFAMGETLRGWFRFQGEGEGKLFVEARHPPYILVRHARGFLFVNQANPDDTKALFQQLDGRVGKGR